MVTPYNSRACDTEMGPPEQVSWLTSCIGELWAHVRALHESHICKVEGDGGRLVVLCDIGN